MTDTAQLCAEVRVVEGKMTKGPWSLEIEQIEYADSTISIPEIRRCLHSSEWAEKREWKQDQRNAEGIVYLRNTALSLVSAIEQRDEENRRLREALRSLIAHAERKVWLRDDRVKVLDAARAALEGSPT